MTFWLKIRDLVEDKQGYLDEKRVWGQIFFIAALVYVFTHDPGISVWTTAGGLAAVGTGLLLAAGGQDGIVPKAGV